MCFGAVGLAQTIHGREGIILPSPPPVETDPVIDDYFGTKITDNYRWLEDAKSTQTRQFIDAQNAYTARYLKQARIRSQILDDLDPLENVTETTSPWQRADSYFFRRRVAGIEVSLSVDVRGPTDRWQIEGWPPSFEVGRRASGSTAQIPTG